jgi:PAS domain S-box-containing protein
MAASYQEPFVGTSGTKVDGFTTGSMRDLSALTPTSVPTPHSVASTRTYQASPTSYTSYITYDVHGPALGDLRVGGEMSVCPAPQGSGRKDMDEHVQTPGSSPSAIRAYYGITDHPQPQALKAPFVPILLDNPGARVNFTPAEPPIELGAIAPVVLDAGSVTPRTPKAPTCENLSISTSNLSFLIDVMPGAVVALQPNGSVLQCNKTAATMFAYSVSDMHGMSSGQLLHGNLETVVAPGGQTPTPISALGQGCATTGKRHDGTIFPVQLAFSPVHLDGNQVVTLVTVVDVSNRIIMVEQPEHKTLTSETNDTLLSHEMRSPLMEIIGYTKQLALAPMPDLQAELVDSISKCAQAMLTSLVKAEQRGQQHG